MGGLRTAEPPRPQRGTATDDGSVENLPRHTAGTDGTRSEHGALARRECGILVPAGTAVEHADTGDTGSEDGHGYTADQDGTDPEEEGDETLQHALPRETTTESGRRRGDPPKGRTRLTRADDKGGEEGGTHHPAARAHGVQQGNGG